VADHTRWLEEVALPKIVQPRVDQFEARYHVKPFWDLPLVAAAGPYRRAIAFAAGRVQVRVRFRGMPEDEDERVADRRRRRRALGRARSPDEAAASVARAAVATWLRAHEVPLRLIYAALWGPLATPSSVAAQTRERDVVRRAIRQHQAAHAEWARWLAAPEPPDPVTAAFLTLVRKDASELEVARAQKDLRRAPEKPAP
jgi:hypothetical protein